MPCMQNWRFTADNIFLLLCDTSNFYAEYKKKSSKSTYNKDSFINSFNTNTQPITYIIKWNNKSEIWNGCLLFFRSYFLYRNNEWHKSSVEDYHKYQSNETDRSFIEDEVAIAPVLEEPTETKIQFYTEANRNLKNFFEFYGAIRNNDLEL